MADQDEADNTPTNGGDAAGDRSAGRCDRSQSDVGPVEEVLIRLREVNDRLSALAARSENRDEIGRATGMLMERYGIGPDEALALLVRAGRDSGLTLSRTALLLMSTRELPAARDN